MRFTLCVATMAVCLIALQSTADSTSEADDDLSSPQQLNSGGHTGSGTNEGQQVSGDSGTSQSGVGQKTPPGPSSTAPPPGTIAAPAPAPLASGEGAREKDSKDSKDGEDGEDSEDSEGGEGVDGGNGGKGGAVQHIPPGGGANDPNGSLPAASSASGLASGAADKTVTTKTTSTAANAVPKTLLPDAQQPQSSQGTEQQDQGQKTQNIPIQGAGKTQHNPVAAQPNEPKTVTTTTSKPVKTDANKEALTRDGSGRSSGSQSLSPILQGPTSNGTPAAKPTRAHTTAPAKSGVGQPSVKVTTTNTSTNTAAQPAQEPAAANPGEKDTTHLQTLKSTTSTAAPTDSKQASSTSTTDFAKGESTVLPTSLPKLSKALQSLDMKDSSSSSSAFFALAALFTFVMMAMALAC